MQSKGSVLLFLAILALPVIAISSNHRIFFAIVSIFIFIISSKYLFSFFIEKGFQDRKADEELEAELEEMANIDVKRFGTGLSAVYNMIVILYLFYCAFFLDTLVMKGITSFAILLQIYFIINKTKSKNQDFDINVHKPQVLIASVSNIIIILFTVMNKISRLS